MSQTARPGSEVRRAAAWKDYELQWPVPQYTILLEPEGKWRALWDAVTTSYVSTFEDAEPPSTWVFDSMAVGFPPSAPRWSGPWFTRPFGEGEEIKVFRLPWPAGGVFAPREDSPEPLRSYNPVKVADEILLDAQRTGRDDPKALLRFVNRWGVLGVGIPGAREFPLDGVALTGEWLARLKGWTEAAEALRRGQKARMSWRTLARALNKELVQIHPAARPTKEGLEPVFRLSRLLDALCVELWEEMTEGKQRRRCKECKALFIPGRADQVYCTHLCANRPTVRKWKLEQKRRYKLAQQKEEW